MYKAFGMQFFKWIQLVTRDEAFHFHNCLEIVKLRYPDRIREVPKVIERLMEWDLHGGTYQGTFVLDHEGKYFTEDFLLGCAGRINAYLGQGVRA